jgi:hypothetical protein
VAYLAFHDVAGAADENEGLLSFFFPNSEERDVRPLDPKALDTKLFPLLLEAGKNIPAFSCAADAPTVVKRADGISEFMRLGLS